MMAEKDIIRAMAQKPMVAQQPVGVAEAMMRRKKGKPIVPTEPITSGIPKGMEGSYVRLDTGEYVTNEDYRNLTKEEQAEIKKLGIDKFLELVSERRAEFEKNYVKLDSGEWIDKKNYEALSGDDRGKLKELGVEKFNEYKLGLSYVKLNTGEYVGIEDFNNLSKEEQDKLKELGIDKFNEYRKEKHETEIKKAEIEWQAKIESVTPKVMPIVQGSGIAKGKTGSDYIRTAEGDIPTWMLVPDFSNVSSGMDIAPLYPAFTAGSWRDTGRVSRQGYKIMEYSDEPWTEQTYLAHMGITPEQAKERIIGNYRGYVYLNNRLFPTTYSYIDPETGEVKNTEGLVNPYGLLDSEGRIINSRGALPLEIFYGSKWPSEVSKALPPTTVGITGLVKSWPTQVSAAMPEIKLAGMWPTAVSSPAVLAAKLSAEELEKQIARGELIRIKDYDIPLPKDYFDTFSKDEQYKLRTEGTKGILETTVKGEPITTAFLNTLTDDDRKILVEQGIDAYNAKLAEDNELIQGQWIPKDFIQELEKQSPDMANVLKEQGYDAYVAKMDGDNIRIPDGKGGFQWFAKSVYAQMEEDNPEYALALKEKGYDAYIQTRQENEYELPDGYWMPKSDVDSLPKSQQEILKGEGIKSWREFITKQETILKPFEVKVDESWREIYEPIGMPQPEKLYDVVTALKKAEKNPELRIALESLYLENVLRGLDLMAGTLKPPRNLATDEEFHKLFEDWAIIDWDKKYQEYANQHPDDARVIRIQKLDAPAPIRYADAVVLNESDDKPFVERVAVEGDVFTKQFERVIDKLKGVSEKANTAPAIATLTDSQIKDDFGASLIKGIDTAKSDVANFWTEEDLDNWLARKDLNPILATGSYAGHFVFDIVKTLGSIVPLTLAGSLASLTYGDVSKASGDMAELVGGMALFPVFFVGQEAKAISMGQPEKAVGNMVGLGATIVVSPTGALKLLRRGATKLTGFPKTFSPGAGSITVDIPMTTIGRQTPGVINTMDALQTYLKDGVFTRDKVVVDSTGKLVARITPLARAGVKDQFHVTNRFNEYADAIKEGGVIEKPGNITSRDSPFTGKGTYYSPNMSVKTGFAIEPVGKATQAPSRFIEKATPSGKIQKVKNPEYKKWEKEWGKKPEGQSGIIAHKFEYKQVPKEIQKIYNELSQLDMKRTPFDVVEEVLNRAVEKYVDMEARGLLEPGTYPVMKMWWGADYAKLIDLLVRKGFKDLKKWKPKKLTDEQFGLLSEYFNKNLTSLEQHSVRQWVIENESYRTFNAPLYATKVTWDTKIKELGDSCAGGYIKASEKMVDPNGKVVFKEGDNIPIMWLSEKPNDLPPALSQKMMAEYIYEPITTLRKLFSSKPEIKLGYKGTMAGDLVGLKIAKRPNVNDYLDLDRRPTAIIRNPRNPQQILVGRQFNPDLGRLEKHYDTIGGSPFKLGEGPTETISREALDEAGVYAVGGKYLGTTKGRHMNTKKGLKYVEDERVFELYETEFKGKPKPSGEVVDLAWYDGNRLYDLDGKPIGGRVSDITPRLYDIAKTAQKNIDWKIAEPKQNTQTEKSLSYKMEGNKWVVKEKPELAVAILEDARGRPLTVDGGLIKVERQVGETTFDALKRTIESKGMDVDSYGYVQRWMDFPEGVYSVEYPGLLTDLYVVKVKNPEWNAQVIRGDELRVLEPRYADAYYAKRDIIDLKPIGGEYTSRPLYISADLPVMTKTEIAKVQNSLKSVATKNGWDFIDWQDPNTFHITLKYNGRIPIKNAEVLTRMVDEVNRILAQKPVHFGVKEWEAWPNYKDMDVVSMRMASKGDMAKITDLQRIVDAVATRAGLPADTYRFEPHITIASIKKGTPIPNKINLGGYLSKNPIGRTIDAKISKVSLKESRQGIIYKSVDDVMATYIDKGNVGAGIDIFTVEGEKIGGITSRGELKLKPIKSAQSTAYSIVKKEGVVEIIEKPKEIGVEQSIPDVVLQTEPMPLTKRQQYITEANAILESIPSVEGNKIYNKGIPGGEAIIRTDAQGKALVYGVIRYRDGELTATLIVKAKGKGLEGRVAVDEVVAEFIKRDAKLPESYEMTPDAAMLVSRISEVVPKVVKAETTTIKTLEQILQADDAVAKMQLNSFGDKLSKVTQDEGVTFIREMTPDGRETSRFVIRIKDGKEVYVSRPKEFENRKIEGEFELQYGDYVRVDDAGIVFMPKEGEKAYWDRIEEQFATESMKRRGKAKKLETERLREYKESKPTVVELYPGPYTSFRSRDALDYYGLEKKSEYLYPEGMLDSATPYGGYIKEMKYGLEYVKPSEYQPLYYGTEPKAYGYGYPEYEKVIAYPESALTYPQYPKQVSYPSAVTAYPETPVAQYPVPSQYVTPAYPVKPVVVPPPKPIPVPFGQKYTPEYIEKYGMPAGSVCWRQGWVYRHWFPPFGKDDWLFTKTPIREVHYATGPQSAFESIVAVGGPLPDKPLEYDMGLQKLKIIPNVKGTDPGIYFELDREDASWSPEKVAEREAEEAEETQTKEQEIKKPKPKIIKQQIIEQPEEEVEEVRGTEMPIETQPLKGTQRYEVAEEPEVVGLQAEAQPQRVIPQKREIVREAKVSEEESGFADKSPMESSATGFEDKSPMESDKSPMESDKSGFEGESPFDTIGVSKQVPQAEEVEEPNLIPVNRSWGESPAYNVQKPKKRVVKQSDEEQIGIVRAR